MLSKLQQECLTDGYVRTHYNHLVPDGIRKIIGSFWIEHIWWILDKEETLKEILNTSSPQITGKLIDIGPLLIMAEICTKRNKQFVSFSLCVKMKENVKSVRFYYELRCNDPAISWRETQIIDQCEKTIRFGWKNQGLHERFEKMNGAQFEFMHFCEIQSIEYKESARRENYHKDIEMKQWSGCEWKINDETMELFQNVHDDQAEFVPSFIDDCWGIFVVPRTSMSTHGFVVAAMLLAMPEKIKEVEAEMTIVVRPWQTESLKVQRTESFEFDGSALMIFCHTGCTVAELIKEANGSPITIDTAIKILSIVTVDEDGFEEEITGSEMKKYLKWSGIEDCED